MGVKSFLILATVFCLGNTGLAAQDENPFEVLKAFYLQSNAPASFLDFDLESAPAPALQCVVALPYVVTFRIVRFDNVTIPGKPGHGPLLPGTPDTLREHCLRQDNGGGIDPGRLGECEGQTAKTEGADFRVNNFSFQGVATVLSFRKSGELIAFKAELYLDGFVFDAYGYCYR